MSGGPWGPVAPPILDMLPGEAQLHYLDQEVDQLSRNLRVEAIRARLSILADKKRQALPARSRSAAPSRRR